MMISALDRKLIRDLSDMKGRAIAIIFVVAAGVATFVNSQTLLYSLGLTRATFYERYRFADVFLQLKRAPDYLKERLAEIPGVAQVQTRIVEMVNLDVPGLKEPAVGQLISLPVVRPQEMELNRLYLRRGRMLVPGHDDEILASEKFVDANKLRVGDSIVAIINGRRKELRIVGVVLSPEYVFQVKPGDLIPDAKHFGVFWMEHEALSNAFDMEGAFNNVTLSIMRNASVKEIIEQADLLADPYGGLGAFERKDQLSHMLLESDIEGLRNMGLIAPTIFLSVSGFLLNVVLSRLTNLQREQIAALKAFGYSNLQIGWHYLKLVLFIASIGCVMGTFAGAWLARSFTLMFMEVYQYPELMFTIRPNIVAMAVLAAGGAAVFGALWAVARAVRLPPAQAMRPEPPAEYKPTFLERIGLGRFVPHVARMILRQLERHPLKTAISILAISVAVGIVVVGNFIKDAVDYVMVMQFFEVQRYDLMVTTVEPVANDAIYELTSLPGVTYAEPLRTVACRLSAKHRSRRVPIRGISADSQLYRLMNSKGVTTKIPPDGLIVSKKLAEILGVEVGETIRVEVLEEKRPVRDVPVVALLEDISGLNAYMEIRALRRLMREGPMVNGAYLQTDSAQIDDVYRELKETPNVAAVSVKTSALETFQNTLSKNMLRMRLINLTFSIIIAVGVVYNAAQISLSERSRELATLRVIGFTRAEISTILLGEIGTVTFLAIPLGLVIGHWMAKFLATFLEQEVFRFPFVIENSTYGLAATAVLTTSILCALLVRRELDHLDLIAVLKSRE